MNYTYKECLVNNLQPLIEENAKMLSSPFDSSLEARVESAGMITRTRLLNIEFVESASEGK